jgi:hypothetical protein
MARNKFSVGQIVDFGAIAVPRLKTTGPYKVTRVLPTEDSKAQRYTIKSSAEPFERNANEYEIVAAG